MDYLDDYAKWERWAKEQTLGKPKEKLPTGLTEYRDEIKKYWNEESAVGILERERKFVGVACLAAKEVTDRESFVKRFGLSFEKDVQWHAVASLLDHLQRSPLFKAVLVTTSKIPFKTEPDVPHEIEGRLNWAKRNFQFHKEKSETLRRELESQGISFIGYFPKWLPKQLAEEQMHARNFENSIRGLESRVHEHMKNYFLIKENLFAAGLFFYVYTDAKETVADALQEITARKYSVKMEILKTYFVQCSDVTDPIIVFNPEVYPFFRELEKYFCLALAEDVAGFNSDKDVAICLKHFFTTALELPTEEPIEEQIHIPSEEVSIPKPRSAFLGYVVESVVKRKVTKRRVYFALDTLTQHAIIFGKTRTGKSFLSLILVQEALANGIRVVVFDPHGTLANRLKENKLLKIVFTRGKADITNQLEDIYRDASAWPETNTLKLLVVLDETRLLKAKNLVYCLNELGKRGVGFILITQYSTSIQAESRNVGTYFIMAAMSETEIERFKEVTLHPGSKLITRLPRAMSFVFSPYFYPEPFFIRNRTISSY